MYLKLKYRRVFIFVVSILLGFIFSLFLSFWNILPVTAKTSLKNVVVETQTDVFRQEQQGRKLYKTGQFTEAIAIWEQAAQAYQKRGDKLGQARVLSNLSLAYQQIGQWSQATEAITDSLNILATEQEGSLPILAQALNTQGNLQLMIGQAEWALSTWEKAEATYAQIEDDIGVLRSQINQAQALKALGLYRRALKNLKQVSQSLEGQPDSRLKVVGLRLFGNTLRLAGDLNQSQKVLTESLAIAKSLQLNEDIAIVLYNLGHIARVQQDSQAALDFYQQAAAIPASIKTQTINKLSHLSLLIDMKQWQAAKNLLPSIQLQLDQLPLSHDNIYAKINFAHNLSKLRTANATSPNIPSWTEIAQLLAKTVEQARDLGDQRAIAYSLGHLGRIYQQTQQWSIAEDLTQEALVLAQGINAPDIAYRWQWQLGEIFIAQDKRPQAITAYSEAVNILKSLSDDLVAINPEVQFSFQESVEPVYRELVSLLLKDSKDKQPSQKNLVQARDVIESLQLAELDNFFREACLDAKFVKIDQVDKQAAVIYPIILSDRLEIILSLPGQSLYSYEIPVSATELEEVIEELRKNLVIRSRRKFFAPAQKLYDWLILPVEDQLANSEVKTLVFVPDGAFRNIPLGTLYDGKQYLIEKYSIALTPGLQLLDPLPLQQTKLKTLAAGLTQERQGFSALDYVAEELEQIKTKVSSVVLLDQEFTSQALREEIEFSTFPVVHIATHGQFSSSFAETFILAWDTRINISQLDSLLEVRNFSGKNAVELLVLSACETAAGDKRAALGLAGMAVRAGARSTMATLWSVNDQATSELMSQFYQEIANSPTKSANKISKAEALRKAQLSLLRQSWYKHPFYWAPYVLVGNWL